MKTIGIGRSFPGIHIVPTGINPIAGGITGTVADIQKWQDGNLLIIHEVAATPGFNVELLFTNIVDFQRVGISQQYDGADNHSDVVQIYDALNLLWLTLHTFDKSMGLNYRYTDLPVEKPIDRFNFIDNGNVKLRKYHPQSGNAAHDAFLDYAALIR